MKKRAEMRIGMPRVLNMYSQTPVFTGYFASLGIQAENIVYSDSPARSCIRKAPSAAPSTRASPRSWAFRTSTTCCIEVHAKKPLDIIFFPMIDCLTSDLQWRAGQPLLPHRGRRRRKR